MKLTNEQIAWLANRVPSIAPVPAGTSRPFWSVLIPTYNRPDLLQRSLASVLDQGIRSEDMDIEVMDDASSGNETEAVVRNLGFGRVSYFRQPKNIGQIALVNDGIRRARGHWIHTLHDDDWVNPGFYESLMTTLPKYPSVGAALTAFSLVDILGNETFQWPKEREDVGLLNDWLWKVATSARVQFPAVVVNRKTYETLGLYSPDFPIPADCEMWVRIASHYEWLYDPRARACYRDTPVSISTNSKRTGENISQIRKVIDFFLNYQPVESRNKLQFAAKRYWVEFALRTAARMIKNQDFEGAANQLRECLATEPSKEVVLTIINLSSQLKN